MALGYGNQFALRAYALCVCRTPRTEETDRDEAAAPNPRRGSQPIDDLGSHHQAWEPRHTTLDSQLHHTYDTGEAQLRFPRPPRPPMGLPIRAQVPNPSTTWGATTRLGNLGFEGRCGRLVHRTSSALGDIHRLDPE